jgi:hypothetical protein
MSQNNKRFGSSAGMRGKPARGNDSDLDMMPEGDKAPPRRHAKDGKVRPV